MPKAWIFLLQWKDCLQSFTWSFFKVWQMFIAKFLVFMALSYSPQPPHHRLRRWSPATPAPAASMLIARCGPRPPPAPASGTTPATPTSSASRSAPSTQSAPAPGPASTTSAGTRVRVCAVRMRPAMCPTMRRCVAAMLAIRGMLLCPVGSLPHVSRAGYR